MRSTSSTVNFFKHSAGALWLPTLNYGAVTPPGLDMVHPVSSCIKYKGPLFQEKNIPKAPNPFPPLDLYISISRCVRFRAFEQSWPNRQLAPMERSFDPRNSRSPTLKRPSIPPRAMEGFSYILLWQRKRTGFLKVIDRYRYTLYKYLKQL